MTDTEFLEFADSIGIKTEFRWNIFTFEIRITFDWNGLDMPIKIRNLSCIKKEIAEADAVTFIREVIGVTDGIEPEWIGTFRELKPMKDGSYVPVLYRSGTTWFVSWISPEDGDVLIEGDGECPEEAVAEAEIVFRENAEI